MPRKICILLLSFSLLLFSGCRNSQMIESAAIIENVSVSRENGSTVYTFYRLTDSEKPWGVSVRADSFEQACALAEEKYIPNLSLRKLRLLMLGEDVYNEVLQRDAEYISFNSSFSPLAYFTVCDAETLKRVAGEERVQNLIEEELILLKNNNPEVDVNYLSVYNSLENDSELLVPHIGYDGELKAGVMSVFL